MTGFKDNTVMRFSYFSIVPNSEGFTGDKIDLNRILNVEITVEKYSVELSKRNDGTYCLYLQINLDGILRVIFVGSKTLIEMIRKVPEAGFPFKTKIVKQNNRLEFT